MNNQFNKPPQPEEEKYEENPGHGNPMENISQGKCHPVKFKGQTLVYIPQTIVDKVSKENILKLIKEIYTPEALEKFGWSDEWSQSDYKHSWMVELPPQNSFSWTERDESDDRVERFIAAIYKLNKS